MKLFPHLDHIAIAVKSLEEGRKIYEDLGFKFSPHIEEVPAQKVRTQFCEIDEKSRVELLEPTSEDSTIAKFIEKKGVGLHHFCFRVDDIKTKQKEMEKQGYKFLYSSPQSGADNCLVNFIHPKSAGGVLVEISQKEK